MTGHYEVTVPGQEPEPPVGSGPTPISPYHQFVQILAERQTRDARLYKLCWRESWVHENKMPDLEPVRRSQLERFGVAWDVLPASPGIPELAWYRPGWLALALVSLEINVLSDLHVLPPSPGSWM